MGSSCFEDLTGFREQPAKTTESRVLVQILTRITERARDVLHVHRVASSRGLVSERAERLEVALQTHQIELFTERARLRGSMCQGEVAIEKRQKRRVRKVDIRVAQERGQVVGGRTQARVLANDDLQMA